MKVVRIDRTRVSKRALAEASAVLRSGGVAVFPTETSYGLAADPADRAAVRKIYAIKGRPEGKPLPLVASSRAAVEKVFVLRGEARLIATKYWPGPLTLVLPFKKKRLPASAGCRDGAVRVPASAWARALARAAGGLVTSTSANRSGRPALHDPAGVRRTFKNKKAKKTATPDLFLDAGRLPVRDASAIVRVKRGKMEVLRQGSIRVKP